MNQVMSLSGSDASTHSAGSDRSSRLNVPTT